MSIGGKDLEDRIMAFDIGDVRIGVAVSSPLGGMALPVETYWRKKYMEDMDYLANLAKSYQVKTIVCGCPTNADGTESIQTEKTREFVEEFKKHTDIPVVLYDERFTTLEAREAMNFMNVKKDRKKQIVDMIAASYILERYMEELRHKK